jgi:FtsH-binding integral membrane protein
MKNKADWLLPVMLLALNAIPFAASVRRLLELGTGAAITADNARFLAAPTPTALHLLCSSVFGIVGAFQFLPQFRRRRPGWHRTAGRLLTAFGLLAALSGLWMTVLFPRVAGDGALLDVFRLAFGTAMALCMVLGFAAIRRRDLAGHRAWMTRGYAIGIGAGTQVVVHIPWLLLGGQPGTLARALLLGAGWAINLALAEWIIRRHATPAARRKAVPESQPVRQRIQ